METKRSNINCIAASQGDINSVYEKLLHWTPFPIKLHNGKITLEVIITVRWAAQSRDINVLLPMQQQQQLLERWGMVLGEKASGMISITPYSWVKALLSKNLKVWKERTDVLVIAATFAPYQSLIHGSSCCLICTLWSKQVFDKQYSPHFLQTYCQ